MPYQTILFEPGAVVRITLNRPDRLNSFTAQMHAELRDALAKLGDARVVVLTGAGRGFCAGQDLNDRAVVPGEAVDLGEHGVVNAHPSLSRTHLIADFLPSEQLADLVRQADRTLGEAVR